MSTNVPISAMLGVVLVSVVGAEKGNNEITFTADDGNKWVMYHAQDCCESVDIDDVIGDVSDLIGKPLIVSEVVSNEEPPPREVGCDDDEVEWTFYRLATEKGHVTLRWYGTSNGYYSTSVSFRQE